MRKTSLSLLAVVAGALFAASPAVRAQDEQGAPLNRYYKVHCEVGLVVHKEPDDKSRRVGTLENGQKVELAGDRVDGSGEVAAIVVRVPPEHKGDESISWIKLKGPVAGYVLFKTSGNGTNADPFEYLVPYSRE